GDVVAVDVVEVAVPGLRGDREQPHLREARMMLDGPRDDPGMDHADRVRVGDTDRPAERSRLLDPRQAGHLAVAILGVEARRHRITGPGGTARMDRRDAGAHRVAANQRLVAHLDAGYVRDRVPVTGDTVERYAQVTRAD